MINSLTIHTHIHTNSHTYRKSQKRRTMSYSDGYNGGNRSADLTIFYDSPGDRGFRLTTDKVIALIYDN